MAVRKRIARNESAANAIGEFTGCQTSMILGYGCMSAKQHNVSDITEAKRRISLFFFVGLLEKMKYSMCLFNYLVTGERFVMDVQLENIRPTNRSQVAGKHAEYDDSGLPHDRADEAIYKHARRHFQAEVLRHNISKENCQLRKLPRGTQLPELPRAPVHGVEPPEEG